MPCETISPEYLLKKLQWRYATKKFDPQRKIPADTWTALEQALVLTPSSFGLQPWKFFVIQDLPLRERLKTVSWNQGQITDASHLVVFAQRLNLSAPDIEHYIERMADVRHLTVADLEGYKQVMLGLVNNVDPAFDINEWAGRQLYLALGNFLTCAAMLDVDTCPMEGIDGKQYDLILQLEEQGYHTRCVATAGYRATNDPYSSQAKVRYPPQEVITHL